MNFYPNQRVSWKEKQKPDWYKPTVDYLITKANSQKDISFVLKALKAANGIIDDEEFKYVLKPFQGNASHEERELTSPINIRGVDFITPIIERLMGEYLELPYKFMVTDNSDDAIIIRDAECAEAVSQKVEEAVAGYLQQMQQAVQSGQQPPESIEQMDLAAFAEEFKKNWINQRAIKGQRILDHVYKYNDFEYQRLQAFYYWLTTNEVYTYRNVENGELVREVISPLEGFTISNGEPYVEDHDGFIIKKRITFQKLIEDYLREDILDVSDIEYLEGLKGRYTQSQPVKVPIKLLKSRYGFAESQYNNIHDNELEFCGADGEIDMAICIFKTETKVQILKYINTLNQVTEMPVESSYALDLENGDISLEKTHINEVVVCYRFGDENTGVYTKPFKHPIQRYDSVTRAPKLPVNGKRGILDGMSIKPIGIRLMPFEVIDRILLHQIESTMAKYKGAILLMPQSLIKGDDTGTTRQKYFYMRADGTLIYDDTDVDFNTIAQGVRFVTDEVLGKYLETLIDLRQANRADAYEVTSMNADRNAQVDTRANVSNVQQNIYRAKLGSALLIQIFNKIFERDHVADLEFGKFAYVNGISDNYYDKDENMNIPYSFDTLDLLETKLGIYSTNSKLEEAKLQFLADSLSHAASQNQDFEIAIEAATTDSIPLLKQRVKELSEAKRQFEQQMQSQAGEIEDKKHQNKMAEIEALNMKDIQVALINKNFENAMTLQEAIGQMEQATNTPDDSSGVDVQAQMKTVLDNLKLQLEERKQAHKERQDKIDNRLKDKKIEADKYIAKINKN